MIGISLLSVIPANAGIQGAFHSSFWIPASAGMTSIYRKTLSNSLVVIE